MTWKVTLPCTRAEAEQLAEGIEAFAALDQPPVLVTTEETSERWRLDAFFEEKPGRQDIAQLVALVPSAKGTAPKAQLVPEQDWVTLSQAGLEPIRAGRFLVHTPAHRGALPADVVGIEIDAGRAFGTGQHETTTGCLVALDRLKQGGAAVSNLVDVGTGTGLLAFAAMHLWPAAKASASDIDPVSVEVTRENAEINGVGLGRTRGRLETVVAAGLDHPRLLARAPYDLIIANILAGPLIGLAPALAGALGPGGWLVLAGLLDHQAQAVATAYRRQGLRARFSVRRGEWPTLVMRRPPSGRWR